MDHSVELRIVANKPELIEDSLKPDVENTKNLKINIRSSKKEVIISIKTPKLSYLQAVINSYLSLIKNLKEVDEIG